MKMLILIYSLFFLSCNRNNNDLENIEIMRYRRDFDSNLNSIFRPLEYIYIDQNGNAKVLNRLYFKKNDKFIRYKINKQILYKISTTTLNLDDQYFQLKEKDFTDEIYCGIDEYIRYRIKFTNRKSISFVLLNHNIKKEKYLDFFKLDRYYNSSTTPTYKISDNDTLSLIHLKNNFQNFVHGFNGQQLYPIDLRPVKFDKQ